MKRRSKVVININSVLFLAVIVGCITPTSSPAIIIQKTTTNTPKAQKPIDPISTPNPNLISSPTSTIESTKTSLVIPVCSQGGNFITPPKDFNRPGTLIYQVNGGLGLYAIGGSPINHSELPVPSTEQVFAIGFSPNGKLLAYVPVISNPASQMSIRTPSIVLLSADGEKTEQTLNYTGMESDQASGEYLFGVAHPSYWINDQLIFTTLVYEYLDLYTPSHGISKLLDPSHGNWVEEPLEKLRDRSREQYLEFSPDMKRVLYASRTGNQNSGIILRDVERDQILWADPYFSSEYGKFSWSPDSTLVAVANLLELPEERALFFLPKDGEARGDVLFFLPPGNFRIFDFGWSPESRYLAIIVDYEDITYKLSSHLTL